MSAPALLISACATNGLQRQPYEQIKTRWNNSIKIDLVKPLSTININSDLKSDQWSVVEIGFVNQLINFDFSINQNLGLIPVAKLVQKQLLIGLKIENELCERVFSFDVVNDPNQDHITTIISSWNDWNLVIKNTNNQVLDRVLPISASAFLNHQGQQAVISSFSEWLAQLKPQINAQAWDITYKIMVVNNQIEVHLILKFNHLIVYQSGIQVKTFNTFVSQKDYQTNVTNLYQSIGRYIDLQQIEGAPVQFASSISNDQELAALLRAIKQDVMIFEQQDFNLKIKFNNNDQAGLINAEFILIEPFSQMPILSQNLVRVLTISGFLKIENDRDLQAINQVYQSLNKINLKTKHVQLASDDQQQIDLDWLLKNTDYQGVDQQKFKIEIINDQDFINDDHLGIKALKIKVFVNHQGQWIKVGKPVFNESDQSWQAQSQLNNYLQIGGYRTLSDNIAYQTYTKFANKKIIRANINEIILNELLPLTQSEAMEKLIDANWFKAPFNDLLGLDLIKDLEKYQLKWLWDEHQNFNAHRVDGKIVNIFTKPTTLKIIPKVATNDNLYLPYYDLQGKELALVQVVFQLDVTYDLDQIS